MSRSVYPSLSNNRLLLFLCVLLLSIHPLFGCAARGAPLPPGPEAQEKYYIAGVPFYQLARQESSCGQAALAAVLSFWNRQISMEQLVSRVYVSQLRGSLPLDMQRFLSEEGLLTVSTAGTIDDMKAQIRRNVPVITLLDLGLGGNRRPHYVTVLGFDDAEGAIIVHDGLTANKRMEYGEFTGAWDRAGNWLLVAMPPSEQGQESR